ncbi:MAG: ABC transporter permease [Acidobacteriota bacterium]
MKSRFGWIGSWRRIGRRTLDLRREVAEELDLYLELRAEELIAEGLEPEEARRRALQAFGDRAAYETACVAISRPAAERRRLRETLEAIGQDGRAALRELARRPGFAVLFTGTLAVCLALHTVIFAVFHHVLLRPYPYPEPDRLAAVWNALPAAGVERARSSPPEYFDRLEAVPAFEHLALYQVRTRSLGEPGYVRRTFGMIVTPSFFDVLGVAPQLGRVFHPRESEPGRGQVVILGHQLWQQRFAGDPKITERSLRIDGVYHRVIGVMPEGFDFPDWRPHFWIPLALDPAAASAPEARLENDYEMLGRLRPGATLEQTQGQLDAWNETFTQSAPASLAQLLEEGAYRTVISGFQDDVARGVRPRLLLLWGGALFVLAIASVSLANLLLMRTVGRFRDLATRHVLGAGRLRLVRQLMMEGGALAALGGGLALAIGHAILQRVDFFRVLQLPLFGGDIALGAEVVGLTLGLATLTVTLSAAAAGWAVHRRDLFAALRAGGSQATPSRLSLRLRGGLVAAQIAVACLLLIGAALMVATLFQLTAVDPGFKSEGILATTVSPPAARYRKPADQRRFFRQALAELEALPGVRSAALATHLPLAGEPDEGLLVPEFSPKERQETLAYARTLISPGLLETLEIPLLAGRTFTDSDDFAATRVVVISEAIARRFWGAPQAAVGQRVFLQIHSAGASLEPAAGGERAWHEVVGVVGDVRHRSLTEDEAQGGYYLSFWQHSQRFTRIAVRAEGPRRELVPAMRQTLAEIDPEIVLFWVAPLGEGIERTVDGHRVPMVTLLIFALVALLLAAVGVYGVLAESVTHRTREIGVRLALGASRGEIRRGILRSLLVFLAAGLAAGALAALGLSHLVESLLYGVEAQQPSVYLGTLTIVAATALMACALPARRATRIDPARALSADGLSAPPTSRPAGRRGR